MAANFRFISDTTEGHANEFPPRRARDRLSERCFTDTRRPHETKDRPFHLVHPLLHGEVFKNTVLDLFQAIMVLIQYFLGDIEVFFNLGVLFPRDTQHPVEIIAHHRRFRRHWAHGAQLLQLSLRLFLSFFAELGFVDFFLKFGQFVLAVFVIAQFLLNGLHLLIQIIFALGFLHLTLDPATDALFHLHHTDFAFHESVDPFQTFRNFFDLQQRLFVRNLKSQMLCNRIGELACFINLINRNKDFWWNLLI